MRACIGRAFAWQEALLVCALILQNFDLRLDDPNYEIDVIVTLGFLKEKLTDARDKGYVVLVFSGSYRVKTLNNVSHRTLLSSQGHSLQEDSEDSLPNW